MSASKPVILLSILMSTFLLLSACGGDDADTAMSASGDSMDSSMDMEKAEGVIYQDEIYANWPYN